MLKQSFKLKAFKAIILIIVGNDFLRNHPWAPCFSILCMCYSNPKVLKICGFPQCEMLLSYTFIIQSKFMLNFGQDVETIVS